MFDIGWTELLVIAVVAIIVVGPKDLPRMLRAFGQTIGKMRRMANEFQSTFNDALKEAEREADVLDMKKTVEEAAKGVKDFDPLADLKKSIAPVSVASPEASGAAKAAVPDEGAANAAGATVPPVAAAAEVPVIAPAVAEPEPAAVASPAATGQAEPVAGTEARP
ncbi:Sec-independent protein translocase protein TatB [Pannonibacter carbonis]|uniref:Sec-independent protein translocase protein TatB n=1 Tax=Pannonibacter carbonis TaxID=2067569 RepID=UPI000D0EE958|nr:Sec-independent protein translocase protein TatB [Pannonibacter carbonis]